MLHTSGAGSRRSRNTLHCTRRQENRQLFPAARRPVSPPDSGLSRLRAAG